MLKELLKNKEFCKITEKFLEKENVLDLILFGSSIKGKSEPNDIDIIIIYSKKSKDNEESTYNLKKEFGAIDKKIELIEKDYEELFSPTFVAREAFISEGFSIKRKEFISKTLGYSSFVLFKYALRNLNASRRMQFYYSLYGRGKEEGMLKKNNAHKFSNEVILSSVQNSEIFKDFFEKWKIEYLEFPIIIPERIAKSKIIDKS